MRPRFVGGRGRALSGSGMLPVEAALASPPLAADGEKRGSVRAGISQALISQGSDGLGWSALSLFPSRYFLLMGRTAHSCGGAGVCVCVSRLLSTPRRTAAHAASPHSSSSPVPPPSRRRGEEGPAAGARRFPTVRPSSFPVSPPRSSATPSRALAVLLAQRAVWLLR